MNPKSKEYQKLEAEWDKKLKDSGFVDIEHRSGNLRWSAVSQALQAKETAYEVKEEYYRAAGKFLWEHNFVSETERLIWKMHCEGSSMRAIGKHLNSLNKKRTVSTNRVFKIIRKLTKAMIESCPKD